MPEPGETDQPADAKNIDDTFGLGHELLKGMYRLAHDIISRLMFILVIGMFIKYRHSGDNETVHHQPDSDHESRDADFHPVRNISFIGRQMPVEGNQ